MVRFSRVASPQRGGAPLVIIGTGGRARSKPRTRVAAFARARADGADGVELDVMTVRDAARWSCSTTTIWRGSARRPERIADTSFAVLRGVTLASGASDPDARRGVRGVRARPAGQRRAEGAEPRPVGARAAGRRASRRSSRAPARARACWCRRSTRWAVRLWMRRAAGRARRPAVRARSAAAAAARLGGAAAAPVRAAPGDGALHAGARGRLARAAATWSTSGPSTTRRRCAACRAHGRRRRHHERSRADARAAAARWRRGVSAGLYGVTPARNSPA